MAVDEEGGSGVFMTQNIQGDVGGAGNDEEGEYEEEEIDDYENS